MTPFLTEIRNFDGARMEALNVEERVRMIERFGYEECKAGLALPNLQTTVREALKRRMRKLNGVAP